MSDTALTPPAPAHTPIRWGWSLVGGILVLLAGVFMLVFPVSASVTVTLLTGWALMFAGVVGFAGALIDRSGGGMLIGIVLSALAVIAGILITFNPLAGTLTLTMVFVYWLLIDGILGVVLSVIKRPDAWVLWLLSSLVSVVLGVILLGSMPLGAGFILGVYTGIVLMFRGMLMIGQSFVTRSTPA